MCTLNFFSIGCSSFYLYIVTKASPLNTTEAGLGLDQEF